jgi:hypothetical protein
MRCCFLFCGNNTAADAVCDLHYSFVAAGCAPGASSATAAAAAQLLMQHHGHVCDLHSIPDTSRVLLLHVCSSTTTAAHAWPVGSHVLLLQQPSTLALTMHGANAFDRAGAVLPAVALATTATDGLQRPEWVTEQQLASLHFISV